MNKYQKIVQQEFLNDEEAVIKRLDKVYKKSMQDINGKLADLYTSISRLKVAYKDIKDDDLGLAAVYFKKNPNITPEQAKETLASMIQSKIYQKDYQKALKKQVNTILDNMQVEEFKTVDEYLKKCYDEGFVGTMYDLAGQGIPMCIPIDQVAVTRAVQLNSKISEGLYTHMGRDVDLLKKHIAANVSRGVSSGMTYQEVAKQLDSYADIGFNKAVRIARTEGHRIQVQSAMDACGSAKEVGADVVKQWDSSMDKRTRISHRHVDGEIRELDEPFSNGLMFPGDPNGGASEVINCRCALLQRARWALDDEELEALKEKAAFFGLDKQDSFDEFKQKYIDSVVAPAVPPKKEYLTKKKLEQNLVDGQKQLDDLDEQFKNASGGWTYDDAIKDFGSLEDFADGDDLKKLKDIKQQTDDLKAKMADWQEKLDKKVASAETKKLKKEQLLLQDEIDNFDQKTYSGIWKDDVTTADWPNLNIQGKKDYYENQIFSGKAGSKVQQFTEYLKQLDELDVEGKKYYELQQKLAKTKADLLKLQKSGKISSKVVDDAFAQARKDAAMWAKTTKEADGRLRDVCGNVWKGANKEERYALYDYTAGSGKFNRPLSGFEKPYSTYGSGWETKFKKGVKNVWIDFEGAGDEIRHMTNAISKSTYEFDMWLQRGCMGNAMESFLELGEDTFTRMSNKELQQFVGRSNRMYSFTSTGVAKGKGFGGDCILNIYAPSGTQMMYAEPFSRFGNGSKLAWDGVQTQSSFGYESEMIIQRGASYTITKIEKSGGTIYIDMEVHPEEGYDLFQQDPSEWTGSKKKGR